MRLITIMKYLGTLTALTAASGAYAANSGFYVGVDAGRDSGAIKTHETFFQGITFNNDYANSLDGFLWGAHAGYNLFLTKRFVLGSEVFWNRTNAKVDWQHSSSSFTRDLQMNNSIGASILPGWQLDSNNRLYARLGWIQSQFDQENNSRTIYGPTFNNVRSDGLQIGLGYLVNLANQWDARIEYDHNDYHTIYRYSDTNSYTYKPEMNMYNLGIDYNFDPAQVKFADSVILPINGWYVGADAGRDDVSMNMRFVGTLSTYQEERSIRGYVGGVHLGYDWQIAQRWLVGLEGFGLINSSYDEYYATSDSDAPSKLRAEKSVGASILPGYQINQSSLLYARIGYIETKFTKIGLANGFAGPAFNTTKPGLELGVGYQVAFTNNWSMFGEYDYADYAEIHTTTSSNSIYNYDPEDNQYKFGVNYHF